MAQEELSKLSTSVESLKKMIESTGYWDVVKLEKVKESSKSVKKLMPKNDVRST
jgi:hypothetical protein